MDIEQQTRTVHAPMNYTVDNGRPVDYYFYEPDPSIEINPPGTDTQIVPIRDGWPVVDQFSVDREGFTLKPFAPNFTAFDNDLAVKSDFYNQVIAFVKRQTGAKRVVVFDHTLRKRLPPDLNQQTTVNRPAVLLVHSDYTVASGPQRVREIMLGEAETLLKRRFAFYNVWKSLYEVVEELPLAMIDASSQVEADLLRMELKYRERTGEIYVLRHANAHRWWYFPHMAPDQALLIKTYDSETDGRARFPGHSAFEDPSSPLNAKRRESIEVRTMAFF